MSWRNLEMDPVDDVR